MRISRETMMMEIAQVVAKRATCFRLNVGAVITMNDRIVSIGYNGRPSGKPHCQGNLCPGRFRCQETIHAEDNAIKHMPQSIDDGTFAPVLYVTDSPCQACARLIIKRGFKSVYYRTPYRLSDGLDDLVEAQVGVYQVLPSGVIMDYSTKAFINA